MKLLYSECVCRAKKYQTELLYLFFGGIAFFLNVGMFALLAAQTALNELINNAICWIVCVLFQFFTNRLWVFDGKTKCRADFWRQMFCFFGGRAFTLLLEELILALFITWLGLAALPVKLFAQIIVIVMNYVISKKIVFKKNNSEPRQAAKNFGTY